VTFSALAVVVVVEDVVVVGLVVVVVALEVVVVGLVVVVRLAVVVLAGKEKLRPLGAAWDAAFAGTFKTTTVPAVNTVADIAKTKPGRLLWPCSGRNDVLDISPPY